MKTHQINRRILVRAFAWPLVWTFALTAPIASADGDAATTVAEELLEIVRAAGIIDDEKYAELRDRAQQEQTQRVEVAVQHAVAAAQIAAVAPISAPKAEPKADPKDWTAKWKNGFRVERNDGAFKLGFGGRVQMDWALIDQDNRLEESIGGEGNGTEIRRAYLYFGGTVYDRLVFKSQLNFANTGVGDVTVQDMYVGLKDLGPLGTVWVGHKKEPFSIEQMTSNKYLTFLERALPSALSPGRNAGLMAQNTAFDDKLVWGLGVFHDTNDSAFGFDDNSAWNVTARVAGAPVYEDDGAKVVHVGASYSHQFRGDKFMQPRYRQRPEAHLSRRFLNTGRFAADDIDLLNVGFATVIGPASLQAEYTHSWVEGKHTPDTDFWGTYAQASYFLTGEHRKYNLGKGSFGRLKPSKNFNPANGDWGAFEIAARFSYLDLEDRHISGGRMWDVTAALNWYLYPNARVMLNYIHSQVEDGAVVGLPTLGGIDGDADIVEARFQFDF